MPLKCVTTATIGAATRASTGSDAAIARIRTAAIRGITIGGDESSTTGSSVMPAIAQSDTTFSAVATAMSAGNTSGRKKTMTASLREGSLGHSISATSAAPGLDAMAVSRIGTTA